MIKHLICLIFLIFVSVSFAEAEVNIMAESLFIRERTPGSFVTTHVVDGFLQAPVYKKLGVFGSFWTQPPSFGGTGYAEGYVGPSLQLTKALQIGAGIGAEHVPGVTGLRYAFYGAFTQGRLSAALTYEDGQKSGRWHMGFAKWGITKKENLGVRAQAFMGSGPFIETARLGHGLTLWGGVLAENIRHRGTPPNLNPMIGLYWTGTVPWKH
jgi:hypothetical protein